MRTDAKLARKSFRYSRQWETDAVSGKRAPQIDRRLQSNTTVGGKLVVHSLSGNERNHLFLNRSGKEFSDISAVSGLDALADSRTFVVLDYDRDGWQDIALVNANTPLLNLYHNLMGRQSTPDHAGAGRMIALRLVGGNLSSQPSGTMTCRDGYGAMVTVRLSDMSLKREHHCGDGYGAQNSATMVVGIGRHPVAKAVSVRWPSGKVQQIADVPAGTLLTVYEDPSQSPHALAIVSEPYHRDVTGTGRPNVVDTEKSSPHTLDLSDARSIPEPDAVNSKLRMFTTMATWCEACKRHLPQVAQLRSALGREILEIVAVPIDEQDDDEKLRAYFSQAKPDYRLLLGLTDSQRAVVNQILVDTTGTEALPSTIITDENGNVLLGVAGMPTVSEARKLLARPPRAAPMEGRERD